MRIRPQSSPAIPSPRLNARQPPCAKSTPANSTTVPPRTASQPSSPNSLPSPKTHAAPLPPPSPRTRLNGAPQRKEKERQRGEFEGGADPADGGDRVRFDGDRADRRTAGRAEIDGGGVQRQRDRSQARIDCQQPDLLHRREGP